jgi:hypothetical protein
MVHMSVLSLAPLPTLMLVAIAAVVVAGGGASIRGGSDDVADQVETDPFPADDVGAIHVGVIDEAGSRVDDVRR